MNKKIILSLLISSVSLGLFSINSFDKEFEKFLNKDENVRNRMKEVNEKQENIYSPININNIDHYVDNKKYNLYGIQSHVDDRINYFKFCVFRFMTKFLHDQSIPNNLNDLFKKECKLLQHVFYQYDTGNTGRVLFFGVIINFDKKLYQNYAILLKNNHCTSLHTVWTAVKLFFPKTIVGYDSIKEKIEKKRKIK